MAEGLRVLGVDPGDKTGLVRLQLVDGALKPFPLYHAAPVHSGHWRDTLVWRNADKWKHRKFREELTIWALDCDAVVFERGYVYRGRPRRGWNQDSLAGNSEWAGVIKDVAAGKWVMLRQRDGRANMDERTKLMPLLQFDWAKELADEHQRDAAEMVLYWLRREGKI